MILSSVQTVARFMLTAVSCSLNRLGSLNSCVKLLQPFEDNDRQFVLDLPFPYRVVYAMIRYCYVAKMELALEDVPVFLKLCAHMQMERPVELPKEQMYSAQIDLSDYLSPLTVEPLKEIALLMYPVCP